jgi:hypothetical protein
VKEEEVSDHVESMKGSEFRVFEEKREQLYSM